ncbi:MBL fold metallo-hydrolase [Numidum massiliense]|uniref:MBL fold metallo-hydrolase n=1 Tax=Numidum massiliense TaxID=1522315 RepID=UPI0009ECB790|nr:MBL fold metallo-hydrolase [Numidum massiliense]
MPIKRQSFVLGPVMTNAYVLWNEETSHGIVVDPGSNPAPLTAAINDKGLTIEAILLTHAHFDHIGGVEEVRKLTGAPVYVHENEADWLTDPRANGSLRFGIGDIRTAAAEKTLSGGETLILCGKKCQVIFTPGHSPGSVSYYFADEELLLSGDVLFQGSIGRTDLTGGDYATLMASIDTLLELPAETRVCAGHGPETTLAREQQSNPFISGR